ncbi:hypothetical protein NQ317_009714 [Molorchus minor]|uniref:Uncharacterized protein n=1 Tax=Molorchus minor TaxID=1323400 RepID=A0ABQ9JG01_9CUCU|nr:hypothetical protein NQ317_009714 [Molorchus minor]
MERYNPSVSILRDHHQTTHKSSTTEENLPIAVSTTTAITTTTTELITEKLKPNRLQTTKNTSYEIYDDDDTDEPAESETVVPVPNLITKQSTVTPVFEASGETVTEGISMARMTIEQALENCTDD